MNTKRIVLFDGQCLEKDTNNYLYQFHMTGEADIFAMSGSKFLLKFVGYIEFVVDNTLYELYCFPKEYNVWNDTIKVLPSTEIGKNNANSIISQFETVISSIRIASQAENSVGQDDISKFYTSNLFYLNEIIRHYNQYGVLVETEKNYKNAPTGKISWSKTIGNIIPKQLNNNLVYDRFIIEKKNQNITFLTKLIAKVIFEGTRKYNFYTPVIDTGIDYSELRGISNKEAISRLYRLKNSTFKDYIHHVIDNLISYLQNDTVSINHGILVGTNNYNFVWEHVVAHALGSKFTKAKKQTIGKYYNYQQNLSIAPTIELDHISEADKIIVDSKYYADREDESIDYKQLFYNYHQVFLVMTENSTYKEVLQEHNNWKNVLIKPTAGDDQFSVYILKDKMKLYSLKINTREYVEYYVSGSKSGKAIYEINVNLNLASKIEQLKLVEK